MAVIGVKSITGITSITNAAGGADVLTFHSNNTTERVRITAAGLVGIGTDNPGSNKLQVQGTSALYGNGGASATWGDKSYLGALSYDGSAQPVIRSASSKGLIFQVNQSTEVLKINSSGQIITGGGSGISFNNIGNSAFGSFFEINGTHTINHCGVLGISGITTTNNTRVGLIQFLNTSNTNTSSTGNAACRSLAHISVYADTSDGNAGNDSGGRLIIGTKGEAAGMNDLLFLTSDKTVGIQAIPTAGDMTSTATGGAALSDPKLYVQDGGTNGKYTLMIRCNGGSDADNTGSAIALNHSNDRGILIEGGRWSGNRSWGAIKAIDNVGRVTDCIAIRGGNGAGVQDFRIYTGEAVATTERLRIDNTGRLSLGEANFTASNDVHIKRANGGGDVALRITNNSGTNSGTTASLYFTTSPTQDFNTSYIQAVRDGGKLNFGYATNSPTVTMHVSTNRVGIASAIPVCSLDVIGGAARFGTANTSKNVDGCIIERNSGDGLVHIAACRTGGNYSGMNFYVAGDVGGSGANAKLRHLIDYQGYFRWYASDGTTERLRINNTGVVQVMSERLTLGTSITHGGANDGNLCVEFSSASRNAVKLRDTHNAGSTTYMVLVGGSATVGSITGTTGQASYNNLSDYRSKENDVKITDGITKLKLLRPIRFNYKTDSSTLCDGFFAHEVTPAVPTAVTGEKDAVDSEGKIDAQMLDTSKMVPLLTAALQEAIAKIETLEAEVVALKSS